MSNWYPENGVMTMTVLIFKPGTPFIIWYIVIEQTLITSVSLLSLPVLY